MQGERLGRYAGLWATSVELAEGMLLVTEEGEGPITHLDLCEGSIVRDKELSAVVFEVFLRDEPGGRWFLIPI